MVDSRGSHQSYAGGIVRAGEYWVAASAGGRPGLNFRVHFTPAVLSTVVLSTATRVRP